MKCSLVNKFIYSIPPVSGLYGTYPHPTAMSEVSTVRTVLISGKGKLPVLHKMRISLRWERRDPGKKIKPWSVFEILLSLKPSCNGQMRSGGCHIMLYYIYIFFQKKACPKQVLIHFLL